ncbi:hypothetical protein Tco_0294486 [Tanacetum coccineum]
MSKAKATSDFRYFSDKLLLMQAQESEQLMDEVQSLFSCWEQVANVDIKNLEHQIQRKGQRVLEMKVLVANVNDRSCVLIMLKMSTALIEQNDCVRIELEKGRTGSGRFRNDHLGAIMGYGDYVMGDSVISRVYYVEGLGHNLFFVGQFCDTDLEVAFRKHTCFVRDINGIDILKGSRSTFATRYPGDEMMEVFSICLMSKASSLPRLKFEKDHLGSAANLEKSKKFSTAPLNLKYNLEVLHNLHMDSVWSNECPEY